MEKETKNIILLLPITLLVLGIIIRLVYVGYFGSEVYKNYTVFQYTHDSFPHIEYIEFVANHFSLPAVEKGLEYPQQPFYYIFSGFLYRLFKVFLLSQKAIFTILAWFSAFFSIGTLIFGYFSAKKIFQALWAQCFIVGLLAFTPAFVYQAGMIGNDPLCSFLSAGALFFLFRYIKEEKQKDFIIAICLAVISFFTKASAGILIIMTLFVLIYKYRQKNSRNILIMAYTVFLIGFLCFGAALYRAYIPTIREFKFVESYSYDGQQTDPARLTYFLNFNLPKLLNEGQSFVYGDKSVVRTFPTFLYGSFLFGEYSYINITDANPFIKVLMQFIILLGLLFPIGIIANIFYIKKWGSFDYASALGCAINLGLIISFLNKYPSVCNSDFRYFAPLFLAILLFSGLGLYRLNEKLKIKFVLPILTFILIFSEFLWIAGRITIRIFTNI